VLDTIYVNAKMQNTDLGKLLKVEDMNTAQVIEALGFEEQGFLNHDMSNLKSHIVSSGVKGVDFVTKTKADLFKLLNLEPEQTVTLKRAVN